MSPLATAEGYHKPGGLKRLMLRAHWRLEVQGQPLSRAGESSSSIPPASAVLAVLGVLMNRARLGNRKEVYLLTVLLAKSPSSMAPALVRGALAMWHRGGWHHSGIACERRGGAGMQETRGRAGAHVALLGSLSRETPPCPGSHPLGSTTLRPQHLPEPRF